VPIGPGSQRAGTKDNSDLSSKWADNVVSYFRAHGVNPNITSAKRFDDAHAVASNDTPQGRAQNRRIEIVLKGPGS
jgi:chemotaxis protein MotB